MSRWPWRASMPNRTLFEGGVHLVDLLMLLFGEKPHCRVRAPLERPRTRAEGRRHPSGHVRVLRGSPRPAHDRPPLQGRDPLRRSSRRLRARVAAGVARRPRPAAARQEARREDGAPHRLRPGRPRVARARPVPEALRPEPARLGDARDARAVPRDHRRLRGGRGAAVERPRGARRARGDRGGLPLGDTGERIELAPALAAVS